jgi:hypothetical protein
LHPGGFGLARLRLDHGIDLVEVVGVPDYLQGVRIFPDDFIEPVLVDGRQDDATPLHRFRVTHRLEDCQFSSYGGERSEITTSGLF